MEYQHKVLTELFDLIKKRAIFTLENLDEETNFVGMVFVVNNEGVEALPFAFNNNNQKKSWLR